MQKHTANELQEGASAKDVAMTAAAESAIAANAEWMRAIQQLVEVRATMVRFQLVRYIWFRLQLLQQCSITSGCCYFPFAQAGALTTAKSFLDPARAATASAQFTATAASLQQIQAEVEKVKTLAVMADLAGKKIGVSFICAHVTPTAVPLRVLIVPSMFCRSQSRER